MTTYSRPLLQDELIHFGIGLCCGLLPFWWVWIPFTVFVLAKELVYDPKKWCGYYLWDDRCSYTIYKWGPDSSDEIDMQTKGFLDITVYGSGFLAGMAMLRLFT